MEEHVGALEAFFEVYDTSRSGSAGRLLATWPGREDEVFGKVEAKYGSKFFTVRRELVALFKRHDAARVATVDRLLVRAAKNEDALLQAARKRYSAAGPAPPPDSNEKADTPQQKADLVDDTRKALRVFFQAFDPDSAATIPQLLERYEDRLADLTTSLDKKYDRSFFHTRTEIKRLLAQYGRADIDADEVLERGLTTGATEADLLQRLEEKLLHVSPRFKPAASPKHGAAAAPAPGGVEARVRRFYAKYRPDKVDSVAELVRQYAGQEETLLSGLVLKYGPEPPVEPQQRRASVSPAAPNAPTPLREYLKPVGEIDWEKRIGEFYAVREPAKAGNAAALAARYKGAEPELWRQLVKRYGAEPCLVDDLLNLHPAYNDPSATAAQRRELKDAASREAEQALGTEPALHARYLQLRGALADRSSVVAADEPSALKGGSGSKRRSKKRARVRVSTLSAPAKVFRMYYQHDEPRLQHTGDILKANEGKEDKVYEALKKKYGADALDCTPAPDDWEHRVVNLYAVYNPGKLSTVRALLQKQQGKEKQLVAALVTKYGTEPDEPKAKGGSSSHEDSSVGDGSEKEDEDDAELSFTQRVEALYKAYNPEKLRQVPALLERNAGRERDLVEALVKKYGPEPPRRRGKSRREPDDALAVKFYYMEHKPLDYVNVPAVLAEWRGRLGELVSVLQTQYGPLPASVDALHDEAVEYARSWREGAAENDEHDAPALFSDKAKRILLDEFPRTPGALVRDTMRDGPGRHAVHEERVLRWSLEDLQTKARIEVEADGVDSFRFYALKDRSWKAHARLTFRRWVAWLRRAIDDTVALRDYLYDRKLSVYDQMVTNRYSAAFYNREQKTKSQKEARLQRLAHRQRMKSRHHRMAPSTSPRARKHPSPPRPAGGPQQHRIAKSARELEYTSPRRAREGNLNATQQRFARTPSRSPPAVERRTYHARSASAGFRRHPAFPQQQQQRRRPGPDGGRGRLRSRSASAHYLRPTNATVCHARATAEKFPKKPRARSASASPARAPQAAPGDPVFGSPSPPGPKHHLEEAACRQAISADVFASPSSRRSLPTCAGPVDVPSPHPVAKRLDPSFDQVSSYQLNSVSDVQVSPIRPKASSDDLLVATPSFDGRKPGHYLAGVAPDAASYAYTLQLATNTPPTAVERLILASATPRPVPIPQM
ncbi:hypothetical protein DIPPA_22633 [Diplonema papillatum]|nr:hypothetical protein DIPPA_22633 [Diplonema papillatum]